MGRNSVQERYYDWNGCFLAALYGRRSLQFLQCFHLDGSSGIRFEVQALQGKIYGNEGRCPVQQCEYGYHEPSVDYKNDGITWFYKTENDDDWQDIDTYDDRDLSKTAQTVQLKAELNATRTTSPILAGETVNLVSFIEKSEGCYVSRTVYMDSPFNAIRVSLEAYTPDGTSFKVYYSTDNETWTELTNPTTKQIDEYFHRYEYKTTLGEEVTKYKVRIDLSTRNILNRPRIRKLMNTLRME